MRSVNQTTPPNPPGLPRSRSFRALRPRRTCHRPTGSAACGASSDASRSSCWRILGAEPFFSEFRVSNPQSQPAIASRFAGLGRATTSAPAPTSPPTPRHLQAHRVHAGRPGEEARRQGGLRTRLPACLFSEVYLHYGGRREVRFRPGTDCPPTCARLPPAIRRRRGGVLPEALRRARRVSRRGVEAGTSCAPMTTCWTSSPSRRDAEPRAASARASCSRAAPQPGAQGPAEGAAVRLPGRGRLFAARAGRA